MSNDIIQKTIWIFKRQIDARADATQVRSSEDSAFKRCTPILLCSLNWTALVKTEPSEPLILDTKNPWLRFWKTKTVKCLSFWTKWKYSEPNVILGVGTKFMWEDGTSSSFSRLTIRVRLSTPSSTFQSSWVVQKTL